MGSVVLNGATSGATTITPTDGVTATLSLPSTTGTLLTSSGAISNLSGGSNGTIPYQSASGTTQMLAVGTSGQVLQTNGAGAPSWVTPSSGAMTLISTLTASTSASLAWTGLSGYNNYIMIVNDLGPSTNNAIINLQFFQSGSWVTSSYYWFGWHVQSGNNGYGDGGGNASGFNIISQGSGNVQALYNNINIFVNNMNNSSYVSATWQGFNQYAPGNGNGVSLTGSGYLANLYGGTGIRLIANSGNLKQGTASLYGISS